MRLMNPPFFTFTSSSAPLAEKKSKKGILLKVNLFDRKKSRFRVDHDITFDQLQQKIQARCYNKTITNVEIYISEVNGSVGIVKEIRDDETLASVIKRHSETVVSQTYFPPLRLFLKYSSKAQTAQMEGKTSSNARIIHHLLDRIARLEETTASLQATMATVLKNRESGNATDNGGTFDDDTRVISADKARTDQTVFIPIEHTDFRVENQISMISGDRGRDADGGTPSKKEAGGEGDGYVHGSVFTDIHACIKVCTCAGQ